MAILSKSGLRQIENKKTRVKGRKVVTDDIRKLKSLADKPIIPQGKINNYYVEPVVIEYYIPKESRFAYETKYLYIELFDPEPVKEIHKEILEHFKKKDTPIDVMDVMNSFPQYLIPILDYYTPVLHMYEALSVEINNGIKGDHVAIRRALYLNEVLRKTEPTMPALDILGDYTTYNINWCIRYLNQNNIEHSLEDRTVHYLIKLHSIYHEEHNSLDERFLILTEIYLEQAFPLDEDEYFDSLDFSD